MEEILTIPIGQIRPDPDQPRKRFDTDALNRLAASLKTRGQRQPGIVRASDNGYVIVDGERRWRAAQIAGLATYRAFLSHCETVPDWFEESVISNFGREEHTHQEITNAIVRLRSEKGYTVQYIADALGKTPSYVFQHLELLKLDGRVLAMVDDTLPPERQLGYSIAVFVLAKIEDKARQFDAAMHIVNNRLNLHQARHYVAKLGAKHGFRTRRSRPSDDLPVLENFISRIAFDAEFVLTLKQNDFAAILQTRSLSEIEKLSGSLASAMNDLGQVQKAIDAIIERRREKAQIYGLRRVI